MNVFERVFPLSLTSSAKRFLWCRKISVVYANELPRIRPNAESVAESRPAVNFNGASKFVREQILEIKHVIDVLACATI